MCETSLKNFKKKWRFSRYWKWKLIEDEANHEKLTVIKGAKLEMKFVQVCVDSQIT